MGHNRKYTVFISSTYEDLKEVREQVVWTCLGAGHIPLGMESFPASSDGVWEVIKRAIDSADYYVVIVATKYGSLVEGGDGISYTEREFDYAEEKGVPVLGFILHDEADWKPKHHETNPESVVRLRAFKEKVKPRSVAFWKSKDDIAGHFALALGHAINTHPRAGWVPSSEAATPQTLEEMTRLSREVDRLQKEVARLGGDELEKAREDAVIAQISAIPSSYRTFGSLLEVFREIGPYFYRNQHPAALTDHTSLPGFAAIEDSQRLAAFGLFDHNNYSPTEPSSNDYRLTDLGRSILKRWEREKIFKNNPGS